MENEDMKKVLHQMHLGNESNESIEENQLFNK